MKQWTVIPALALMLTSLAAEPKQPPITRIPQRSSASPVGITAQSVVVMDAKTGQILYEKNADDRRFPASTTKILTALVAIEHLDRTKVLTAPFDIKKVTGSSLYLQPGERMTVDDLIHALLLRSANDAAVVLARAAGGSERGFADLLNEKAASLGCKGTHFTNPNGLPDENHYTTAEDLALMGQALMKNEYLAQIVGKSEWSVRRTMNSGFTQFPNRNEFLNQEKRAVGIKTGFTDDAGKCFVGAVNQADTTIITVLLKSSNWVVEQKALTEWVDKSWAQQTILNADERADWVPLKGGWRGTTQVSPKMTISVLAPTFASDPPEIKVEGSAQAPFNIGASVAEYVVRLADGQIMRVPAIARNDESAMPGVIGFVRSWPGLFSLAALGGGVFWWRAEAKRRARKRQRARQRTAPARPATPRQVRRPPY